MKGNSTKFCVNLYERTLKTGKIQLYLKIGMGGRRIEESTGILIDPNDKKKIVKEKREAAEAYKRKREEDMRNIALGRSNINSGNVRFFEYYDKFTDSHPSDSTRRSYRSTRRHIEAYEPRTDITFNFITKDWIIGLRDYLLSTETLFGNSTKKGYDPKSSENRLSQNTASCMFRRAIACINHAVEDGIIPYNPASGVKSIAIKDATREFLSEEELSALRNTECRSKVTKNAFLFSCFTGLRFSDVKALSWSMIKDVEGRKIAVLKMKKTGESVYIDLSNTACSFMGDRSDGLVFSGLKTNVQVNKIIEKWKNNAGIEKHVTFHIARHTFATLLLKKDTNLYVVSKLLGHKKITTTQIYAKIVDKSKQKAVDSLDDIFK